MGFPRLIKEKFLGFRAPILQKVEPWMAGLGLGLGLGGEGQEKRFT